MHLLKFHGQMSHSVPVGLACSSFPQWNVGADLQEQALLEAYSVQSLCAKNTRDIRGVHWEALGGLVGSCFQRDLETHTSRFKEKSI